MVTLEHAQLQTSELASEPLKYKILSIAGQPFHADTVIVSFLIVICTLILLLFFRKKLQLIPTRIQTMVEMILDFFNDTAVGMGGEKMKKYVPFILSFFVFILISNLLGLIPPMFKYDGLIFTMPPTRDLNTTLALALISFSSFHYCGFREKGLGYFSHYLHPLSEVLPLIPKWAYFIVPFIALFFIILNCIEECARVFSLTIRLMGNILGEHIVLGVLVGTVFVTCAILQSFFILGFCLDVLPCVMQFMALLTSLIQAFIFSVLTASYIATAISE